MTERVLLLEPVGGIAGDMFLAAAIDLGVSLQALEAPLRTLGVSGWRFEVSKQVRHAITGTHVDVVLEDVPGGQPHRGYTDIVALIRASQLLPRAKERALEVFRLIGEVEAKVHGTTLAEVHFHEVGAVDSIIDICGAAVALELLGVTKVFSTPPPLGSGTVRVAHGVLPVPVPATMELLHGLPVRFEGVGELTTPTGAALLKAFAIVGAIPSLVVERTGYGVGTKDFKDRANVLRSSIATLAQSSTTERLQVLECNVDDCSPQVLAHVMELALAQGALDAWVSPVVMKKSRAGHVLSVLCEPSKRAALTQLVFREATTLGVRSYEVERTALERRFDVISTEWGEARVKVGLLDGAILSATPEFEDVKVLAAKSGKPLKELQAELMREWSRRTEM